MSPYSTSDGDGRAVEVGQRGRVEARAVFNLMMFNHPAALVIWKKCRAVVERRPLPRYPPRPKPAAACALLPAPVPIGQRLEIATPYPGQAAASRPADP